MACLTAQSNLQQGASCRFELSLLAAHSAATAVEVSGTFDQAKSRHTGLPSAAGLNLPG